MPQMFHQGDYAGKTIGQTSEPCKPGPIFSSSLTSSGPIANENMPGHHHPLHLLETQ